MTEAEIEALVSEHEQAPHTRVLQKTLGKDVTIRVHGDAAYHRAIEASEILFGKDTAEQLMNLEERDLLDIFEGVPQFDIAKSDLEPVYKLLTCWLKNQKFFSLMERQEECYNLML